uniref:Putative secreted protein n=1 Tax=Anopheles darlingi TaxID=43151 RepID=A0A2M4DHM8_ANODA
MLCRSPLCCWWWLAHDQSALIDDVGSKGEGWPAVPVTILLELGIEIDLIVEPTIVLSSSLLGIVVDFPQVFRRQLPNKHLCLEEFHGKVV